RCKPKRCTSLTVSRIRRNRKQMATPVCVWCAPSKLRKNRYAQKGSWWKFNRSGRQNNQSFATTSCCRVLMRIWIDLANSPHVPFFRPLANEFTRRGHEVIVTARQFAETVPLAEAAGFAPEIIGAHGGAKLAGKAGNVVGRGLELARWA